MEISTSILIGSTLLLIIFLSCLLAMLYSKSTRQKKPKLRYKLSSIKRMVEE